MIEVAPRLSSDQIATSIADGSALRHSGLVTSTGADPACIFCDIVAGRAEASVVYQDERVLAFMDIRPVTTGHTLVIPKAHVANLADLDAELGGVLFQVAHRLAGAFRSSGVPCEGVNLFLADGAAAGQEVFHTHVHVFPRFSGDGFRIDADWRARGRDELDAVAGQLRAGLGTAPDR